MDKKFTGMFEKALGFALEKHKGQHRKGSNIPYYWHPINVARNIEEFKKSKNLELLMTAALLHDTVEDCTNVTLQEIAEKFGYMTASLVDELTSDEKEIKKIGKTEYLKNKMMNLSSYGLVIKLSDRLDNVRSLQETSKEFQERYTKETNEILAHIESWKRKLTQTHKKLIEKIKSMLISQNTIVKNK